MASFPERTADAWLAIALASRFPAARLWSPTQTVVRNWDVAAHVGGGKVVIFESKGCNSLKKGHSIRIDWQQLDRYVNGQTFAPVKHLVFYVLPSPPWECDPPATPVVPPAAVSRTLSPKGPFADWSYVISAQALYRFMHPRKYRSINTRQLPGSPKDWPTHWRDPVPGPPPTVRGFLEDLARCRHVPRLETRPETPWHIPAVDDRGNPIYWDIVDGEVIRSDGPPRDRDDGERDRTPTEDLGGRGAPSPVVAFIPDAELDG